jgi:single-strand DNA-binding protein
MARSVNTVTLLGNIGRDAETKFTQSGAAMTKFSVATSRRLKKGDEWVEETDWHNIVVWRQEKLANYLVKGKQVYLSGRLQTRSWDDPDTGKKRYATEVVADEIILCGGERSEGTAIPDTHYQSDAVPDEDVPF